MSDHDVPPDGNFVPSEQRRSEDGSDVTFESRISDIMADPMIPPLEKRLRLEELRNLAGAEGADEEAYAPIQTQLLHALALLADGGHDYEGSARRPAASGTGEDRDPPFV